MNSREFQARLSRRVRRAGGALGEELGLRLEAYYRILATWNKKINLSGLDLDEPTTDVIDRLLVEPLVAASFVAKGTKSLLDIGSGGGSPAIPMALSLAGVGLTMVESKTRKSVFLREAVRALEMSPAEVVTMRYEELLSHPAHHESHDLVTVRAVRLEPRLLGGLQAFLCQRGQLFLFQSSGSTDAAAVSPPLILRATHRLVESTRSQLVILEKHSNRHN